MSRLSLIRPLAFVAVLGILTLGAYRVVFPQSGGASSGSGERLAAGPILIPVEIIETGEAPSMREIELPR